MISYDAWRSWSSSSLAALDAPRQQVAAKIHSAGSSSEMWNAIRMA
jgi:hypothetical protein